MQFTALNTIPQLEGKSREIRLLFAETVNHALSKGRCQDEAILNGLAVVRQKEQVKTIKSIKPSQPLHLKALLDVRNTLKVSQNNQEALEKASVVPTQLDKSKEISGASFTEDGRLILVFKDGSKIETNRAPIQAVETNVIVVNETGVQGATPEVIEGLKELTYTGEDLSRVDMPDGSYKLLTYVDTVLTQVDHVQLTQTVRQTLYYTSGVLTSVNTEII